MLRLENVTKKYGSLIVVDDMNLEVKAGEVLGVIGPNGAGKTSLFSVISGQTEPEAGTILFGDQIVTSLPSYKRCVAGMGRTFQVPRPFHGMTVFESARVAANYGAGFSGKEANDFAVAAVENTGLLDFINEPCSSLTLLNRKRLELTRAMATNPKLLLLDEIGGGLTDHEIFELIEIYVKFRKAVWQ